MGKRKKDKNSAKAISERFARLGVPGIKTTWWPDIWGDSWCVDLGDIECSHDVESFCGKPEDEVIKRAWDIIADPKNPVILKRIVVIPNKESGHEEKKILQVRWNNLKNDWEDVPVNVVSYNEFRKLKIIR